MLGSTTAARYSQAAGDPAPQTARASRLSRGRAGPTGTDQCGLAGDGGALTGTISEGLMNDIVNMVRRYS